MITESCKESHMVAANSIVLAKQRPGLPEQQKPTVPRKTMSTLTSSNSDSVHISIFSIIPNKSNAVATFEYSKFSFLKNYIGIVAFWSDLRSLLS